MSAPESPDGGGRREMLDANLEPAGFREQRALPPTANPSLWLVSTPIGNMGDITARAVEVLKSVSLIACEDTRRTGLLLKRLGISARSLVPLHEHNEATAARRIVERLAAGETAAYVTDAGTPTISDPGRRLVETAVAAGLEVSVAPGPSAVTAALAVSGLPTERWAMEGFLPRSGTERAERLAEIAASRATTVIFESPKRAGATLRDLGEACGPDRPAAVARELTKLHEEVARGSLESLANRFAEPPKGEIVLVIGPAAPGTVSNEELAAELSHELAEGASVRDAAAAVAQRTGAGRNRTYRLAIGLADTEA